MTKWLPDDKSDLNWPKNIQRHSQNVTFISGRVTESCQIGNQPLYIILSGPKNNYWAQEWIPTSQNGSLTTKAA